MIWLWAGLALAAEPTAGRFVEARGPGEQLDVYDVSETHVAVRLVSWADFYVDCGYAGMKHPNAQVELALWDLAAGTRTTWLVYEGARRQEQCTPRATSEARLEEAKAAFAAAGLDITKKPAPDLVGAAFDIPRGDAAVRLEVRAEHFMGEGLSEEAWADQFGGAAIGYLVYDIMLDGQKALGFRESFGAAMGARLNARAAQAWIFDDHVVVMTDMEWVDEDGKGALRRLGFVRVPLPSR